MRIDKYILVVCIMIETVVTFACKLNMDNRPLTNSEIKVLVEKSGDEREIRQEVDYLFQKYGDSQVTLLHGADLVKTPLVVEFAAKLNGEVMGIWPAGDRPGTPSYLRIRFGDHRNYRLIMIFPSGVDLSSISAPYEKIADNIYMCP